MREENGSFVCVWVCETVNERSGVVSCDKGELIPLENVIFFSNQRVGRLSDLLSRKRPPKYAQNFAFYNSCFDC
jgi:hypothetical protein